MADQCDSVLYVLEQVFHQTSFLAPSIDTFKPFRALAFCLVWY